MVHGPGELRDLKPLLRENGPCRRGPEDRCPRGILDAADVLVQDRHGYAELPGCGSLATRLLDRQKGLQLTGGHRLPVDRLGIPDGNIHGPDSVIQKDNTDGYALGEG